MILIRALGWSFALTVVALAGALVVGGPHAFALVAILCVLEISLSFDNAVINATVLARMDAFWQRMFLTIGILIAVFGMRLAFPLLIVGLTAHLGPAQAVRLALQGGPIDEPGTYAFLLHAAHPSIAAFGGLFLLMLFLDFVFTDRELRWLTWVEQPLARIGRLDQLPLVVALVVLAVAAQLLADRPAPVLLAGVLGVVTYLLVNGLGELFSGSHPVAMDEVPDHDGRAEQAAAPTSMASPDTSPGGVVTTVTGRAAFFLFLYLQVLDASFSFDGVVGAFAITQNIFIIATGLGVGALYIRSVTVYLVRKGTLSDYVYLEHGAFWAIGALAAILLVSIKVEVPEVVTGLVGVGFVGAAMVSSVARNRRHVAPLAQAVV